MKTIMIYRRDFKETAEANFFEDILEELGIPPEKWDDIYEIEISVSDYFTNLNEQ